MIHLMIQLDTGTINVKMLQERVCPLSRTAELFLCFFAVCNGCSQVCCFLKLKAKPKIGLYKKRII